MFQSKVTLAYLQAQADLNGDGTDGVLVFSHGTTVQARLLHFCLQLMVLCPKSACYPAEMVAKVCSKEELVAGTMLTDQTHTAKPESTDNAYQSIHLEHGLHTEIVIANISQVIMGPLWVQM